MYSGYCLWLCKLLYCNTSILDKYHFLILLCVCVTGELSDSDSNDSDSELEYMAETAASENLCLPALQYLKQCSIILQSMWKMPACPLFHGAKR